MVEERANFIYPLSRIAFMSKQAKDVDHLSMDNVRNQISSYEHQIREYLDKLDATVETYKFSVEKQGDGLIMDISLRATLHSKVSK
jgi:hypothetical protein